MNTDSFGRRRRMRDSRSRSPQRRESHYRRATRSPGRRERSPAWASADQVRWEGHRSSWRPSDDAGLSGHLQRKAAREAAHRAVLQTNAALLMRGGPFVPNNTMPSTRSSTSPAQSTRSPSSAWGSEEGEFVESQPAERSQPAHDSRRGAVEDFVNYAGDAKSAPTPAAGAATRMSYLSVSRTAYPPPSGSAHPLPANPFTAIQPDPHGARERNNQDDHDMEPPARRPRRAWVEGSLPYRRR